MPITYPRDVILKKKKRKINKKVFDCNSPIIVTSVETNVRTCYYYF